MIANILLFLCAIPLIIYPGILMGCLMGLADLPNSQANSVVLVVARAFMWSSLLYPIGYIAGVAVSYKSKTAGAVIAVSHLTICVALFAAWWMLERLK
jgi:hypothetical protein